MAMSSLLPPPRALIASSSTLPNKRFFHNSILLLFLLSLSFFLIGGILSTQALYQVLVDCLYIKHTTMGGYSGLAFSLGMNGYCAFRIAG